MSQYTPQYFIYKLSAIPEELWYVGDFTNPKQPHQHCAYGHLGCSENFQENPEANAFDELFRSHDLLAFMVNDGPYEGNFTQPTPKQRILAALESFK